MNSSQPAFHLVQSYKSESKNLMAFHPKDNRNPDFTFEEHVHLLKNFF